METFNTDVYDHFVHPQVGGNGGVVFADAPRGQTLPASADGQKGMDFIMVILLGTVPTSYALNPGVTPTQDCITVSRHTAAILDRHVSRITVVDDAPGGHGVSVHA